MTVYMKNNALLVVLWLCLGSFQILAQAPDQPYVPGKVIVKFKDDMALSETYAMSTYSRAESAAPIPRSVEKIFQDFQVRSMSSLFSSNPQNTELSRKESNLAGPGNIYLVAFDEQVNPELIAKSLNQDQNVAYAEPDYWFYGLTEPNDENVGEQWYLNTIQAFDAWQLTTGRDQVIAILDTGVDPDHPDLQDKVLPGYDFINEDDDPRDDNMHGTHVAGIAAASTDNGLGIAGVAPDAMILPVKVLQSSGAGSASTIAMGVQYAIENGATVINMSLGSSFESLALKEVLSQAYASATLVASAGNNGAKMIQEGDPPAIAIFPACYPFVLGVEATNESNEKAGFSNFDPTGPIEYSNEFGFNYEMKAPGTTILSTIPGGSYRDLNGTSMAAPMVAGAAALLRSFDEDMSNEEIFARMIQSSEDGILRINEALNYDLTPFLSFQSFTLADTLDSNPGDGDFEADAGELIGLSFLVRNAGGEASSVYVKLALGEFEDPAVATIGTDSVNLGDIGIFGTLSHPQNPLTLTIAPDVAQNREIVLQYEIGAENTDQEVVGEVILTVTNAEELLGILSDELTLTADKLWVVNGSFRISETGILNIEPGTQLMVNSPIINNGMINSIGEQDNRVSIFGPKGIRGNGITELKYTTYDGIVYEHNTTPDNSIFGGSKLVLDHAKITNATSSGIGMNAFLFNSDYDSILISNSEISNIDALTLFVPRDFFLMEETNLDNVSGSLNYIYSSGFNIDSAMVRNNNFSRITNGELVEGFMRKAYDQSLPDGESTYGLFNNNFIAGEGILNTNNFDDRENVRSNYWGTIDSLRILSHIYDFWDNPERAIADFSPYLQRPSASAPGVVWKVLVNGTDPQEAQLDPIGAEEVQFEVYFNKPMDTLFTPFLTFGLREPRTQHVVHEDASWSSDSTIWTAHYTVDFRTGDGLNTVRVSGARDKNGFLIPVEDNLRFQFNIQTVGSLSNNLLATPGFGQVEVSWDAISSNDLLGYNVYRYTSFIEDDELRFRDTLKINEALILDSTFVDEGGDPDTDYYYMLTSLDANFSESGFSSSVQASPLSGSLIILEGDLSFGEVALDTETTRVLTLSNQGNSDLTVTSVSYPDGFSGDWDQGVISAGSSQEVNVTFSPTATIDYSGTIEVTSDASTGDNTIAVSGTGVGSVLTLAGDLSFDEVAINTTATLVMVLSNEGNSDLSVTSVSYPEGFSGDWDQGVISAGNSQEVNVTFSPTAAIDYIGAIEVTSDATTGDNTIAVSGTGAGSVLTLTEELSFGEVALNTTATLVMVLSNDGISEITVTSVSYPEGFSGDWDQGTISAGSSQEVNVTFSPTAVIDYVGTIEVTSDATTGDNTIAVSGTGTGSVLALAGDLSFGEVEINTTATLVMVLSNEGNSDLTVTSVSYPDG